MYYLLIKYNTKENTSCQERPYVSLPFKTKFHVVKYVKSRSTYGFIEPTTNKDQCQSQKKERWLLYSINFRKKEESGIVKFLLLFGI